MKFRPRDIRPAYLKSIFFWNPLISLFITLSYTGLTHRFWLGWAIGLLIADLVTTFCMPLSRLILMALPPPPERELPYSFTVSALLMPLGLWIAFNVTAALLAAIGIHWHQPDLGDYREGMIYGSLILLFFFLKSSATRSKEAAKEAKVKLLQAQVSALTAQMNPHLLFNALNTIAAQLGDNPSKAEETLLTLSDLYRGVLDASRKGEHTLSDELALCRSYLAIEKARFGERLRADIEISPQIQADRITLPVLLLQPLIENAVKHGISPRAEGGNLSVRVGPGLTVIIEDDGIGYGNSTNQKGSGTGLKNCQERLSLRYGNQASFEIAPANANGRGTRVSLRLPETTA